MVCVITIVPINKQFPVHFYIDILCVHKTKHQLFVVCTLYLVGWASTTCKKLILVGGSWPIIKFCQWHCPWIFSVKKQTLYGHNFCLGWSMCLFVVQPKTFIWPRFDSLELELEATTQNWQDESKRTSYTSICTPQVVYQMYIEFETVYLLLLC